MMKAFETYVSGQNDFHLVPNKSSLQRKQPLFLQYPFLLD